MAESPAIKIYAPSGYRASVKGFMAAACLAWHYGPGTTVRVGHAKRDTVWTEPEDEEQGAKALGFDVAATMMLENHRTEKNRRYRDREARNGAYRAPRV